MFVPPRVATRCAVLCLLLAGCASDPKPVVTAALPEPAPARMQPSLAGGEFGRRVAAAVQADPSLLGAEADLRAARAQLAGTGGAWRPAVSVGASAGLELRSSGGTGRDAGPYLRVSQLLWDGGAATAQRHAARAGLSQGVSARLVAAAGRSMEAVEAWLSLWEARAVVALMADDLEEHRRIAGQITERLQGGTGAQSDDLTARSRLAEAETRLVEAELVQQRAVARYAEVFGTAPGAVPLPPAAPVPPAATAEVQQTSPRLQSLNARYAAQERTLAALRASRNPRLLLDSRTAENDVGSGVKTTLGLSVEFAFDTRREAASAEERAAAELDRIAAERAALMREIGRALDVLQAERTAGSARLAAARRAAELSRESAVAASDEFSIGRRRLLDLLEAQRDYTEARRTVLTAERSHIGTGYEALWLTGDIVSVFGLSFPDEPAE